MRGTQNNDRTAGTLFVNYNHRINFMEAHDVNYMSFYRAFLLGSTLLLALSATQVVRGDPASFDLIGPRIEMTVTRGGKTLPISSVPNLQPGDRMWIHPDFPDDQSVHYLLIVAFLQGSTNPPPENWFIRLETWTQKARDEGTVVTVPRGAEQALLFLAPETGGDFATLRSAVRGRPGVFVRASRDLEQASMDRTRIDKYLDEIRQASGSDSAALHQRATLVAQTLHIKVNEACFDKPVDEQPSCLTQNMDQLLLDDGHGQTAVAALVSGPSADLAGAISSTPAMGAGYYSAYVGAVVDMARVLDNLHTAEYQYIPALVLPKQEQLNLRLNSPPSFHNPKSVLVVGLPTVEPAQLPTPSTGRSETDFLSAENSAGSPGRGCAIGILDRNRARFCTPSANQIRRTYQPTRDRGRLSRRIHDRHTRTRSPKDQSRDNGRTSRVVGFRPVRRTHFSAPGRAYGAMEGSAFRYGRSDRRPRGYDPCAIRLCRLRRAGFRPGFARQGTQSDLENAEPR